MRKEKEGRKANRREKKPKETKNKEGRKEERDLIKGKSKGEQTN